ncbi:MULTISPECIES: DUF3037 domain-containing protein [Chryseobacterium]|jgi:hypothetical protein|uniref:DUF3037 domain-containing protein n=1 Tax=Chryseobacterium indoltheticum TaxID=254 RepID=A0A381FPJ6_9FLAO|nr:MULTISPECIES: DUF3037 domain-containing protein [Chryseobacterium]AZA62592.1 DUF3037 domain-containing protein [Chryseobacterium indoltheticum]MDF2832518.1 hypothetical protein [Chryseobacterium indoltheticum]MDQ8143159.1 DUF3037 domain-containing protein [Chryseobacterium sp. CFS15]QQQ27884.1 DUF3037 domain-containing protein [Chryseobacterium indoltheticum]SUX48142.1 Protein of uncharacterised function (DUF3037) [Chryseobacterium indoltheticum]
MQEDKIYEYAIIRLVPKVEREEFFNIGLVMFSKREKFIRMAFYLCPDKFKLMHSKLDYEDVYQNLEAFKKIADGTKDGGPIASLEIPERFRWLTAVRSSVVQTSRPHPGKSKDLDKTFEKLFEELVK